MASKLNATGVKRCDQDLHPLWQLVGAKSFRKPMRPRPTNNNLRRSCRVVFEQLPKLRLKVREDLSASCSTAHAIAKAQSLLPPLEPETR